MLRIVFFLLAMLALGAGLAAPAAAARYSVGTGEYKFTGRLEPLVTDDRKVDIWARVYFPRNAGAGKRPLIVFLHGNHGTCGRLDPELGVRVDDDITYTTKGRCPRGYVVTPNHEGYAYLGRELASRGFYVVSINANRGITAGDGVEGDYGLNLMRGRLVLRHLALLSAWNDGRTDLAVPAKLGFDPRGRFDMRNVGLMGHSRGGEGVRAALQQYRDRGSPFRAGIGPMRVRAIFEIAPVDGQTDRVLSARDVASMILLPACDGDVSTLEGVRVFDRSFRIDDTETGADNIKGTLLVRGANHNAYNTEWLTSDAPGCGAHAALFPEAGRSKRQQQTAFHPLVAFFAGTLGRNADADALTLFNPSFRLPAAMRAITTYDRGYLPAAANDPSAVRVIETFGGPTGFSDEGLANRAVGVTVEHHRADRYDEFSQGEHDPGMKLARISWTPADLAAQRYFELRVPKGTLAGRERDVLSLRLSALCFLRVCTVPSEEDVLAIELQLKDSRGKFSRRVPLSDYARITRPLGAEGFDPHTVLETIQIPLDAFTGIRRGDVTGIRFIFTGTRTGRLHLGQIALVDAETPRRGTVVAGADEAGAVTSLPVVRAAAEAPASADRNSLTVMEGGEILLASSRPFPAAPAALPVLKIGSGTVLKLSRRLDDGRLAFRADAGALAALDAAGGASLTIGVRPVWRFDAGR